MSFGQVIKKLREERGWSQEELAHRVGISTANISRIETGKHGASETLKVLLAREFGYKVYQLIALAEGVRSPEIPPLRDQDEETLLDYFRSMDKEQRSLFKAVGAEFVRSRGITQKLP